MNTCVLCVGKLKEKFLKDGVNEYLKRLSAYGKYELIEVNDEPDEKSSSQAVIEKIKNTEGERLLKHIDDRDYVVALTINGKSYSSEQLSIAHDAWHLKDKKRLVFVIGGSNGLSDAVIKRADEQLSFSKLTFPHGLMRVILLEQIYRSRKISAGEKYHK